jgi:hypothetical protein
VWRYSSNAWRTVSPANGPYAAGSYYARITATSGLPAYRLTRTP